MAEGEGGGSDDFRFQISDLRFQVFRSQIPELGLGAWMADGGVLRSRVLAITRSEAKAGERVVADLGSGIRDFRVSPHGSWGSSSGSRGGDLKVFPRLAAVVAYGRTLWLDGSCSFCRNDRLGRQERVVRRI